MALRKKNQHKTAFGTWYTAATRGADHGIHVRMAKDFGVTVTTLWRLRHGLVQPTYATAERISRATGGEVSVRDLCSGK